MGRITGECSQAQIRIETRSFQFDSRGHFEVTGNDALIKTPMRRKRLEQIQRPRKGANRRRPSLDRMAIAASQVSLELRPLRLGNFYFNICRAENIFDNPRIGIPVRYNRPDITFDAESFEQRFVKRNIAVLATRKRTVDIEKN